MQCNVMFLPLSSVLARECSSELRGKPAAQLVALRETLLP